MTVQWLPYTEAVNYLVEHPGEIFSAWINPFKHKAGCLFQFVTSNGDNNYNAGCLSMIKSEPELYGRHLSPELVTAIVNDPHLPIDQADEHTTREQLQACAKWQQQLDRKIRGK